MNPNALKLIGFCIVLFLFSCYKSNEELSFLMSGDTQTVKIREIYEKKNKYGRVTGFSLEYKVKVGQKRFNQAAHIGVDEVHEYQKGQEIVVEFLDDKYGTSRLEGQSNIVWILIFFGALFMLIGSIVYLALAPKIK